MLAKILAKSIRSLFILLQALQHACMNNVLPGKTASQHDHQEAGKEDQDEEDNDLNARQIQTERKLRDDSSGVLRRHIWQN